MAQGSVGKHLWQISDVSPGAGDSASHSFSLLEHCVTDGEPPHSEEPLIHEDKTLVLQTEPLAGASRLPM